MSRIGVPNKNRITIDASSDDIEQAKISAIALVGDSTSVNTIDDLFYIDKLSVVENGIKNLNSLSNKTWVVSAILLYSLIFDKELYKQSGLDWIEYQKQARERLGLDSRDIAEQLSAARFYIRYHDALERYGWSPEGSGRKLARAELALELSGDLDAVLEHLVNDSWRAFKDWYQSFKPNKSLPAPTEYKRNDIDIQGSKIYIQGKQAVSISDDIPEQDKERIEKYIGQIFEAIKLGYEPAIVPVYDEKEARVLTKLRDKYRQGK